MAITRVEHPLRAAARLQRTIGAWRVVLSPFDDRLPLTLNAAAFDALEDPNAADVDPATVATLSAHKLLVHAKSTAASHLDEAAPKPVPRAPAALAPISGWDALATHLVTFGCSLETDRRLDISTWRGSQWDDALERMRISALIGPCYTAIDQGWLVTNDEQTEAVERLAIEISARALMIERTLLRAARAFHAAEVPFVVLKGVAVAHLDHHTPVARQFGDADVFVADRCIKRSTHALQSAGFSTTFPVERATPALKAISFVDDFGITIDVHRRLADGIYGTTARPSLEERESFFLAGVEFNTLPRSERFAHAALHARRDLQVVAKTGTLRDLAVIKPDDDVRSALHAWKLISLTRQLARDIADVAEPLSASLLATTKDQRASRLDRRSAKIKRRSAADEVLTTLRQPNMLARVRYVRARLFPGKSFRQNWQRRRAERRLPS